MDRRTLLHAALGKKKLTKSFDDQLVVMGSLTPFNGSFDYYAARHLLNRCNFGASHSNILQAVDDGLEATLDKILTNFSPSTLPLNSYYENDPNVPIGETWVARPFALSNDPFSKIYRTHSLTSWTYEVLIENPISIQEKMTLFWHNHFAIHDIKDARFGYKYISTLRSYSLGNFKDLVKAMTIDPMMLRFLNGHDNIASSPNENYARELLELFTIGKGDLVAPGDYTHYTEDDIQQIARVLTGWRHVGRYATDGTMVGAEFLTWRHDAEVKTLSHRFNNAQILPAGDEEYANLIDVIFQQEEVSKYICRKLYRWLINFEINETVEAEVIIPLAELFRTENYEIKPVLRELLGSDHFFSDAACGCIIKNPFDFTMGLINTFEIKLADDFQLSYQQLNVMAGFQKHFQMKYFDPPSVAGWKAYYQQPLYYQTWLNSVTLPLRTTYVNAIANDGVTIFSSEVFKIDPLKLVDGFDFPQDVNQLIDQIVPLIFPKPITIGQKDYLKNALLDTLPDDEWTIEFAAYSVDPDNEDKAAPIRKRLQNLLTVMLTMAEFQLM